MIPVKAIIKKIIIIIILGIARKRVRRDGQEGERRRGEVGEEKGLLLEEG